MTSFSAVGGLELYKGMNLSLPLPTRLFIAVCAPLQVKGGSFLLYTLWTVGVIVLERKRGTRSVIDDLTLKMVVMSGLFIFAGASMIAGWLPLFQLIGNLG